MVDRFSTDPRKLWLYRLRQAYAYQDIVPMPDLTDALCSGTGNILFYPNKGDSDLIRNAKKLCEKCPVQEECGEWAIQNNEDFGIWGGLTVEERKLIRRQRSKDSGGESEMAS